ncbi:uncharacterized protein LOC126825391 isoform X1 [Patella vulgata]|uniref:uncharacterized protein LOC126825391 isoform X1 n=2 Tax=Patella vulgata TaxID=6465 RepID=UPI0021801EF8|nr:uncharacterized protein LOC126825391 isoform X1 [Patella vulgata]
MAPKSKKGNSTPKKMKRQARPRPKAKVSEPETATEEVESSTPEPPQGSKNRQSKKMGIKVTARVHAAAAAAGVPGSNGSGEEDELLPDVANTPVSTSGPSKSTATMPVATQAEPQLVPLENPASPSSPASHDPTPEVLVREEPVEEQKEADGHAKGKGKKPRKPRGPKKEWKLPPDTEQDLVEWMRDRSYLWMRSQRDYKKKTEAWEAKAKEIGISTDYLGHWWKNLKDWYVRLIKVASGQERKLLTDRDKWVLNNISFYKAAIPDEESDTVMQIRRTAAAGSTTGSAAGSASTSTARPPLLSLDDPAETERQSGNVLEDLEREAAELGSVNSSFQHRKRRRKEDEAESWMPELRKNLQTNQTLLAKLMEKMLEDKEREKSQREPFISYVTQTLRSCSLQDFNNVKELISDILKQIKAQSERPSASTSAPPTCTAASFGQYHQYHQQYPQHQQYFQTQPNYYAWQHGVGGGGGGYQQQQQYPGQQELQQPNLSTPRQHTASSESMPRAQSTALGGDWSFNMEQSNFGRVSQDSMNTPPFSTVSPATHRPPILASAALGAPPSLSTPPAVEPTAVESDTQSVATQGTRDSYSEDEDA